MKSVSTRSTLRGAMKLLQSVSKSKLLDCGGTDAALAFGETDPVAEPAKAPSPLRSALLLITILVIVVR
jgi:hypothetical protein